MRLFHATRNTRQSEKPWGEVRTKALYHTALVPDQSLPGDESVGETVRRRRSETGEGAGRTRGRGEGPRAVGRRSNPTTGPPVSSIRPALTPFVAGIILAFAIMAGLIVWAAESIGVDAAAPRDGRATTATWYEGSRGACGGSLTGNYAASRWYACGTHVRLTHHNRAVTVVIKDRCVCAMDVSPSAFRRLAPLSRGVVSVRMWKR
jgi:hypothetical protein